MKFNARFELILENGNKLTTRHALINDYSKMSNALEAAERYIKQTYKTAWVAKIHLYDQAAVQYGQPIISVNNGDKPDPDDKKSGIIVPRSKAVVPYQSDWQKKEKEVKEFSEKVSEKVKFENHFSELGFKVKGA